MRKLLHISDVHFGPPHVSQRAKGVLALVEERQPDLVVLSGDLTQRALPAQFREARDFIDRIRVPTLAVPGNHDVPFHKPILGLWRRALDPYGLYRRHFDPDLEPVFADAEMLVVGINTAHGWTVKEGRIRLRRLLEVRDLLAAAAPGVCKIVVAHHPLIPPPNFGSQRVVANAGEAIDLFSAAGVAMVLSGHQHQAYIGSSEEFYPQGRRPVLLLHAGTTTSNRGRGGERDQSTCNWVEVDAGTILVSRFAWDPELGRFAERSRHLYPRPDAASRPGAPFLPAV